MGLPRRYAPRNDNLFFMNFGFISSFDIQISDLFREEE